MSDNRKYHVIDLTTGNKADIETIARSAPWAKQLNNFDMDGFAIGEEGELYLLDECGQYAPCPGDRFRIVYEDESERICQLCDSYDKQSCYCMLHSIWIQSDFCCKAWEPEGAEEDE